MYLQYSEGFPGVVVENERIFVEPGAADFDSKLEALYKAYFEGAVDDFAVSPERAAGLYAFLSHREINPRAAKGQVIGPISWGLSATDRHGRVVLADETLADAVAKFLRLKAASQERQLQTVAKETVIFIDEPYLATLGSATAAVVLAPDRVKDLIGEVLRGLEGITGIHCCGAAEWPLLLGLPVDIISFDAYNYAASLALYPAEVKAYLARGGTIAWGIVPNDEQLLFGESVASLADRLGEAVAPFTREGPSFRDILSQSLVTPSCGLAALSPEAAETALSVLAELSTRLRARL
jgi:methionine synthase II (cobalamin-independent)